MPIDRTQYRRGVDLIGGEFLADGRLIKDVRQLPPQPPAIERKPPADPRVLYLQKRTAQLAEIATQLERLEPKFLEAAAALRRR
jgi:hypothetical protein